VFGTIVVAVALPFSPLLLSVGQFFLVANWLVELGFKRKFEILLSRKSIIFFISIFLVHIVWLINTSNFSYAFHDLKIKLPLFALPLIFGTTQPFNRNEFKIIIHFLLTSVLLATFVSVVVFLGFTKIEPVDHRNLSIFISHIRFALLIVLCIYIILSLLICYKHYQYAPWWVYLILIAWFIFFVVFMGAFTGLIVLFLVAPFALFFWLNTKEGRNYKRLGTAVLSIVVVSISIYMGYAIFKYQSRVYTDESKLEKYTANGNKYSHYPNNFDYENDERVWLYVCDPELKREWEKLSAIKFEEKDNKGQLIRTTLIRYLTSMSCRKDSVGISELTPQDVEMIEHGYTNYIYKKKLSVYPRLYQLFWEIETYLHYGNPSGHSLTQRFVYIKNALHVIQRHFWFGTGTGDVNDELQSQFEIDKTVLAKRWQARAHNQIITFFLSFGLVGFLIIFFAIYRTIYLEKNNIDFITFTFLLIVLFSMLNEDTFETQAGASFLAVFISLFIFGRKLVGESQ
jgi:hypothetical protein